MTAVLSFTVGIGDLSNLVSKREVIVPILCVCSGAVLGSAAALSWDANLHCGYVAKSCRF